MKKANYEFVQVEEAQIGKIIMGEANIVWGKVISVGSEVKELKKGDMVLFDKFKGITQNINNKNYWFIPYKTIFYYENN